MSHEPAPAPRSGDALRSARAGAFARDAADYAAARPAYPDAAIDQLVPVAARDVLDLAAGTGKLTAQLVARGLRVAAVEPARAMRDELVRAVPGAVALDGTAERIPLADASVDAVLVAQAWHWFEPDVAAAEIARVLRPGGRLGIVWNLRDERVGWVSELTEIIHRGDELDAAPRDVVAVAGFGPVTSTTVGWTDRLAPGGLRRLAASRSHLLLLPEHERDALLRDVDALEQRVRDDDGLVSLPYVTHAFRADLPA